MSALEWTAIGVLLTFSMFLANVIYKMGHLSARLEAIESWRIDVRKDLHEVSNKMENITISLNKLTTLIEERTERRLTFRESTVGKEPV